MLTQSITDIQAQLESVGYVASNEIATVIFLAESTQKPILVEGPAGVGKTELAKAVSKRLNRSLIRLQCYEGLDEAKALYEWEYAKQLLYTQIVKEKINDVITTTVSIKEAIERIANQEDAFFSERFIQTRPLLQAISSEDPVVLLIDEVDKSDPEFEAFLLELLSDFQVSIPEIGTRSAIHIPFVILTSNNYRDMSDALKRRCIHLYIDYPDKALEMKIVHRKQPDVSNQLNEQLINCINNIRKLDLKKKPCISESIDWARSLLALEIKTLSPDAIKSTLNVICKYKEDVERVKQSLDQII